MSDNMEIIYDTQDYENEVLGTNEETIVGYDMTLQVLTDIYNDVHIIMVFTIVTFVTACFRGWRKNVVKGVR